MAEESSDKDCEYYTVTRLIPLASKDSHQPMPGAYYCLGVLTAINVLNYTDRYIPSSTKEYIIEEFNLTDAQSGTYSSLV